MSGLDWLAIEADPLWRESLAPFLEAEKARTADMLSDADSSEALWVLKGRMVALDALLHAPDQARVEAVERARAIAQQEKNDAEAERRARRFNLKNFRATLGRR